MHASLTLASCLVSLVGARAGAQQEWPRFRGPNGSGVATDARLPDAFAPEENLRWRTEHVPGHSSPVLGDGVVFVTGADEKGLVVTSLARATGERRFERRLERARTQEVYHANGSASPSPATDGTNVFAFFPELGVVSFDADGKERWRLPLGPFVSFYGMAASPILAGDTLVLLCDQQKGSFLLAIDATTGKERWRTERKGLIESWATPVLHPASAPRSVLCSGTFFVCSYSLATGAEEWRQGGFGYTPVPSPVAWERAEDTLLFAAVPYHTESYPIPSFASLCTDEDEDKDGKLTVAELAGSGWDEHFGWVDGDGDAFLSSTEWTTMADGMATKDHGLVAYRLSPKGAEELWRHKRGLPSLASPLLHDGVITFVRGGGMVTTLDAASGKELGFLRLEEAAGEYAASPVAGDGKLFLASQDGRITVLAAGPEPTVLSSCDLGETLHATPALGKDALFVRTDAAVYCFAEDE